MVIKMYNYYFYGLHIASEIPFSDIPEITTDQVDVTIRLSQPPQWVLDEYAEKKYSSITENIMWFRLEDELLIYAENGTDVSVWQIDSTLDFDRLVSYVLSGALTFIMLERGYTLLHGSALCVNNKSYIISGPSGSGKSTTSLELLKMPGVCFASDDICAIKITENGPILFPGPPIQRLCPNVAEKNKELDYTYIHEQEDKLARTVTSGYVSSPLAVAGMFIINKENCAHLNTETLSGAEKLNAITHNMFRGELQHVLGITPRKVILYANLANSFPIYYVNRPNGKDTLKEICEFIYGQINR